MRPAVQRDRDVAGEQLGLGEGVLGVGGAGGAVRVRVRHAGAVAGRPDPGQGAAVRSDRLQGGQAADPADGVQREVGVAQQRGRPDACRPDQGAGAEAAAVGQCDDPADGGLQGGAQPDVDTAFAQLAEGVSGEFGRLLGEDPVGRLDQHPAQVLGADVVVAAYGGADHVLQFRERADARVAGADEDEGERGLAQRRVAGGGGEVQLLQDVVAQGHRLADGGEAEAVLGEAGHRGRTGDRPRGHHQDVVGEFDRCGWFAGAGGVGQRAAGGVFDRGDPGGEHPAVRQHPAQRDDDVSGVDRAGRDLGEQRVVREVGLGLDDGDLHLAAPQPLPQAPLEVERGGRPGAAAADDQDPDGAPPAGVTFRPGLAAGGVPPSRTPMKDRRGWSCPQSVRCWLHREWPPWPVVLAGRLSDALSAANSRELWSDCVLERPSP